MTPGSTAPEGSRVTPVSAPVEAVWLNMLPQESAANVRATNGRNRLERQSR